LPTSTSLWLPGIYHVSTAAIFLRSAIVGAKRMRWYNDGKMARGYSLPRAGGG
jgi:hypothetical protein